MNHLSKTLNVFIAAASLLSAGPRHWPRIFAQSWRATAPVLLVGVLFATSGCGSLGLGGKDSRLGDGQIDVLKLLAIAGGIQSGDAGPLCQTILAGQSGGDEATEGLLLAACRGLLGQLAPQASVFAAPSVVAGSAVPSGSACDELKIAFDVAANACKW